MSDYADEWGKRLQTLAKCQGKDALVHNDFSEKRAYPNNTLFGFDIDDIIFCHEHATMRLAVRFFMRMCGTCFP
jgi:hypothetical protein